MPEALDDARSTVHLRSQLDQAPAGSNGTTTQIRARRWQQVGRAVVMHNGPLTDSENDRVAVLNCGPRSVLTAFSALTAQGLRGWSRPAVHVLVPSGARVRQPNEILMRVNYTGDWAAVERRGEAAVERIPSALVRAASTLDSPRSACGLVAAAVQQRLLTADHLLTALQLRNRIRHRRILLNAAQDIGQGAQALSEIDFARLCRQHGLPPPTHQAVRIEPNGRRRYLDASRTLPNGVTVAVEIDGAMHLAAPQWFADQLRQNEITLTGALLLRFPSVIIRTEPLLVMDQHRRALQIDR